jgi:hypothetical protein
LKLYPVRAVGDGIKFDALFMSPGCCFRCLRSTRCLQVERNRM